MASVEQQSREQRALREVKAAHEEGRLDEWTAHQRRNNQAATLAKMKHSELGSSRNTIFVLKNCTFGRRVNPNHAVRNVWVLHAFETALCQKFGCCQAPGTVWAKCLVSKARAF